MKIKIIVFCIFGLLVISFLSLGASRNTAYASTTSVECGCTSLLWFDAVAKDNAAVAKWETGHELNVLGFNVLRSNTRDGVYIIANPSLIPANNIGQVLGSTYRFKDTNVKEGKKYFYKLEVVKASGGSEYSENIVRVVIL